MKKRMFALLMGLAVAAGSFQYTGFDAAAKESILKAEKRSTYGAAYGTADTAKINDSNNGIDPFVIYDNGSYYGWLTFAGYNYNYDAAVFNGQDCTGTVLKVPETLELLDHEFKINSVYLLSMRCKNRSQVRRIEIPEGVKKVNLSLDKKWKNLKVIAFPKSIKNVYISNGHIPCKVTFPKGAKYEFRQNGIYNKKSKNLLAACGKSKTFRIKEGTKGINSCAFLGYSELKKLYVPSSLKVTYKDAFQGLTKSCTVYVPNEKIRQLVLDNGCKAKIVIKK